MSVVWVSKEEAAIIVASRVIETEVVLDVGPGIHPQRYFQPLVHICVEPHLPYLEHLRRKRGDDPRHILLNCTWEAAMKILLPKSVDTVFALDFIEHLEKSEGSAFLREAERVARRQIVVYTPLGFYPQTYEDSEKPDRWGMDGGFWQTHRSGWHIEDFDDRWELLCCEAYHFVDENEQPLAKPFGAIWAFCDFEEMDKVSYSAQQRISALGQRAVGKLKYTLKGLVR
jgi:hypothetical protein